MKKGNFLYLGIAITYISLACIQLVRSTMLSVNIYSFVAWASFELTLLEMIKSLSQYIQEFRRQIICIIEDELQLCNNQISVFKKNAKFSKELAESEKKRREIERKLKARKNKRDLLFLGKVVNIITILQVVACFIMFAVSISSEIPNNLATSKMIGILSLLSFAFLFISYYLKSSLDEQLAEGKMLINSSNRISNYYIDLLEKVSISEARENGNHRKTL